MPFRCIVPLYSRACPGRSARVGNLGQPPVAVAFEAAAFRAEMVGLRAWSSGDTVGDIARSNFKSALVEAVARDKHVDYPIDRLGPGDRTSGVPLKKANLGKYVPVMQPLMELDRRGGYFRQKDIEEACCSILGEGLIKGSVMNYACRISPKRTSKQTSNYKKTNKRTNKRVWAWSTSRTTSQRWPSPYG